jgi:hypothetical protein
LQVSSLLSAGEFLLVAGEFPLLAGEFLLVAGEFLLVAGEFPLLAGEFLLVAGEFLLVAGKFLLVAGEFPLLAGEFLQVAGGTVQQYAQCVGWKVDPTLIMSCNRHTFSTPSLPDCSPAHQGGSAGTECSGGSHHQVCMLRKMSL